MTSAIQNIREHAHKARPGTGLTAKGLLHFGSRAAVDQALSRLARSGELERVSRGLYVRPVRTRFGKRLPEVAMFLSALSEKTGETITPSGALVANRLGLTDQVPVRQVYLTSGRSRELELGALKIELRHAPGRKLVRSESKVGDLLRSLFWASSPRATTKVIEKSVEILSAKQLQELLALRTHLGSDKAQRLSELVTYAA